MNNTQANLQCVRCQRITPATFSSSLETVQPARWPLRRTLRQCLQSVDRQEPERFLPNVAMLGQRTLLPARSGRLVSCESRARSLERDASACAPSGAALSVVPAQPGIVHSRIAAWDVGGPLYSLLRGADKCLASSVSPQILATEQPGIPNFIQVRAFTTRAHTGMCINAQKSPIQKRVYKRMAVRYKCGVGSTQNYTIVFCVLVLLNNRKGEASLSV